MKTMEEVLTEAAENILETKLARLRNKIQDAIHEEFTKLDSSSWGEASPAMYALHLSTIESVSSGFLLWMAEFKKKWIESLVESKLQKVRDDLFKEE